MDKITFSTTDLKKIIDVVDQLKTYRQLRKDAITITSDSSSGIGSIVTVAVPILIDGVPGSLQVDIADESNW